MWSERLWWTKRNITADRLLEKNANKAALKIYKMLHDKEVDNTGHFLNNETIFSAVTVTTVYKAFSLSILKLHFHVYIIRPFILCDKNISNSVSNQNFIKISCSKFQRIGIYFSKNKGKYICRCLILQIYEFVLESLI